MVVVPAGEFIMGSPSDELHRDNDEGPQHKVIISQPFAVGRYAVTFDEWDAAQADKDWQRITGIEPRKPDDKGWGRGDRPVINVSWDDAQAYVKWLSEKTGEDYRLPTEAQWEYACRAGTATPYWWGDTISKSQVNYNWNNGKTVPVKSFQPNPWGLYQVHGNVWEWCADDWRPYSVDTVTDPVGPLDSTERALRGGSWYVNARDMRAASRFAFRREGRSDVIGFRCARVRK
jgi:formylglycine-generating enzyme required for sulfatase activity